MNDLTRMTKLQVYRRSLSVNSIAETFLSINSPTRMYSFREWKFQPFFRFEQRSVNYYYFSSGAGNATMWQNETRNPPYYFPLIVYTIARFSRCSSPKETMSEAISNPETLHSITDIETNQSKIADCWLPTGVSCGRKSVKSRNAYRQLRFASWSRDQQIRVLASRESSRRIVCNCANIGKNGCIVFAPCRVSDTL